MMKTKNNLGSNRKYFTFNDFQVKGWDSIDLKTDDQRLIWLNISLLDNVRLRICVGDTKILSQYLKKWLLWSHFCVLMFKWGANTLCSTRRRLAFLRCSCHSPHLSNLPCWLSLWDTPRSLLLCPDGSPAHCSTTPWIHWGCPVQTEQLCWTQEGGEGQRAADRRPCGICDRRWVQRSGWFRLTSFHPPSCLQTADRNLRGGSAAWTQHGVRWSLQLCL